jgi:hypothetical protein
VKQCLFDEIIKQYFVNCFNYLSVTTTAMTYTRSSFQTTRG